MFVSGGSKVPVETRRAQRHASLASSQSEHEMNGALLSRPMAQHAWEKSECNRTSVGTRAQSSSDQLTHLLNVVISDRLAIVKLLATEDEALLLRRDALLVLRKHSQDTRVE